MKITVVRIIESNGQSVRHEAAKDFPDRPEGWSAGFASLEYEEEARKKRESAETEEIKRVTAALFASLP